MGYKVVTAAGMATREFEYPDAEAWTVKKATYLKVGEGDASGGALTGERYATFNWDNVIAVEEI